MIATMQDTDGNRYIWDELLRQWVPVTGAMSPAELAAEMAPTLRSQYLSVVGGVPGENTGAAIQAALDAVPAAGGRVVLADVDFEPLTVSLKVKDNTELLMGAARLSLADGANTDIIRNADPWTGNTGIKIHGGILNGNRANQTSGGSAESLAGQLLNDGPGRSLVSLMNVQHSSVTKVSGTSPWLHGVDVSSIDIDNNSLITLLTGAITGTPGTTVTGGTSGASGTYITHGTDSRGQRYVVVNNVTGTFVSGETITSNSMSAVVSAAPMSHGSSHVEVDGCVFTDFGDDGVTTHWSSDITITDCLFWASAGTYSASSNGVEVDDGSHDVVVTGCISIDTNSGFIAQGHTGRLAAHDVSFVNCVATGCVYGFRLAASGTRDATTCGKNISITGGIAKNSSAVAVFTTNYSNVAVSGLVMDGNLRPWTTTGDLGANSNIGFSRCVIDQAGSANGCELNSQIANCTNYIVEGCLIRNVSAGTTVSIGKDGVVFRNNTVEDCSAASAVVAVSAGVAVVVEGNRLTGTNVWGVIVSGSPTQPAIRDNTIVIAGTAGGGVQIASGATPSKTLVTGNQCRGGGRGIYNLAGGGSGLVTANSCDANSTAAVATSTTGGTWTTEKNLGADI